MRSSISSTNLIFVRRIAIALALLSISPIAPRLIAQNTPVLSGGAGFLTVTNRGKTTYELVTSLLIAVPVGSHLFFEGRGNLLESITPASTGGYNTSRFFTLSYMQADVLVNKHVTFVGGYFLTPFGTYNERLTPVWIDNFLDAPLIYGIGNMNNGSSTGGMIRGNAISPRLSGTIARHMRVRVGLSKSRRRGYHAFSQFVDLLEWHSI